jgi:hypothetical protein
MHEADESRLPLTSFVDRRIKLIGVLLSEVCLAYFYMLDRVFFSSAHFSPIFRQLLTGDDFRAGWLGLVICLLAAVWNRPAPILRLVDSFGNHPCSLALVSTAMIALGVVVVYHGYPLSMDEYAGVFQSKVFASGHLVARLPRDLIDWLVVRGFNGEFLVASPDTGKAIEHYWPGFALLLAPFEYSRVPWLCNATFAALALVLIHWITKEITGERRAAGWALLFTVASGVFAADAVSYYSMQAHLTANLLFVALLLKPTGRRALGAGFVGSLALTLHNPVPHTLFAIPWIVAMAAERGQRRYLLFLMLGYLPGMALGVAWLVFRANIAGVHGTSPVHGITAGVFAWPGETLLNMRTAALVKMWIWMVPGLLVFAVLGRLRRRDNPNVRLLMQSAVLTFAGYLFVRFDQGHGWGYRYFHSAWGALPILAGCAMAGNTAGNSEGQHSRLLSFAGAAAILNLVVVMPFQMHQISDFISQHMAQIPPPQRPGNNVYFIHPRGGFYVADMIQFDPLLRDRDLKLVSHGTELDGEFIRQNWPGAVKIVSGRAADQWYLGPRDQRLPIPGRENEKHFVFTSVGVTQP